MSTTTRYNSLNHPIPEPYNLCPLIRVIGRYVECIRLRIGAAICPKRPVGLDDYIGVPCPGG